MVCGPMMNSCPCTRPCTSVEIVSPLMTSGEPFRFRRGDVMWQQGENANYVIAVCTGMLRLTGPGEELPAILELIHRGQVVGEEAALPGMHRPSTCSAVTAGKGMRISRDRINALLAADPELYRTLLHASIRRTTGLTRRMEEVTTGSVKSRLARVLVRLDEEIGLNDARGRFVPAPLKRGDLAEMISCRVETVIRTMTDWQRRGLVDTQREGFILRSTQELLKDAEAEA